MSNAFDELGGTVTLYGAGIDPFQSPRSPDRLAPPSITWPPNWVTLPHGGVSPSVARGLAALLPLLRAATKGRSATPDEAAAMAWLEGLAAGVGA